MNITLNNSKLSLLTTPRKWTGYSFLIWYAQFLRALVWFKEKSGDVILGGYI
jgi:hypothetical protein